ncbi:MAG: hypothetical protein ABFS24_00065 [Pseudomonadota bacterium]
MDEKQQRREWAIESVGWYKRDWERTGNPLNVWRAYVECRDHSLEMPEWVYEYFDRVGGRLWDLSYPGRPKPGKGTVSATIAEALEMKGRGKSGRGNVFTVFEAKNDSTSLAVDVYFYLEQGHKLGMAYEYVAGDIKKKTGKGSKSTVIRAWEEWGPILFEECYNKHSKK